MALGVYQSEGGMERFNQRLVRSFFGLKTEGQINDATVISLWDDPKQLRVYPGIRSIGNGRNKISTVYNFLKIIIQVRPEKILYGHIFFRHLAMIAKIIHPNHTSMVFIHGTEVRKPPSKIDRWIFDKVFNRFLPVSLYLAQILEQDFHLPPDRILPFLNAIDDDISEPENRIRVNLPGSYKLFSICRLSKTTLHKNIDRVIKAMTMILEKYPDTHYYIAGDGDWTDDLKRLCVNLHLESNVHFTGWLNDEAKIKFFQSVDLFILPSEEGFGIVFLEAWKYHLPIIGGTRGAAPEIIENGKGGLCVEPDPLVISQAVMQLLSDPKMRKKMGDFGFAKLQKNYLHHHFQDKLAEYLCRP